jgi:fucose permease
MSLQRLTGAAAVKSAVTIDHDPLLVAWRNAVFAIFGISGFVFATWVSRVPDVRSILHASTAEMGLLILGIAVGAIAGLLASSHIVAALGATRTIKWAYTAAPVGLIVAGIAASVAPGFVGLLIGLILFGIGNGSLEVAMNLSGAASERAIGRPLMPLFHAVFSLGTVAGAAVGALTLLLGVPIGVHLGIVGVLAVVATHVLVRFLQPAKVLHATGETDMAHGWRSRLSAWRDPRVLMIGVLVLGFALAEGSASNWLSLAMIDGHGVSQAAGAAIFGVFVAAMTIGRASGMVVLERPKVSTQ